MLSMILMLACATGPLATIEDSGCKLERWDSFGKVTFPSGKVVFYQIDRGQWINIDPETETIQIFDL